jgi:uracil-DNA glycosylase family 4
MNEPKYIAGYGPLGAKLMILGECPTIKDTTTGKGFVDSRETDHILRDAGINKNNCWLSYVSKYHVPPNIGKKRIPFPVRAKEHGINIEQQIEELQNEVNSIKPNCILALGKTALWALSGRLDIQDYRGSILHGMGVKFVPTYNPQHLSWQATDIEFKGYWNRQIMLFDFKRALAQSRFPELHRVQRSIEICQNSAHLADFRARYRGKIRMATDIEASGTCIPICVGLAFSKHHAMVVPLWNVEGISHIPDADMIQVWLILAEMLWENEIVGQNFNYDRDKLRRIGFIIRKLADDIMLKAHAINPELPKKLAFNTSIYTEEPFYKNEGMYQGSITDLLMGCGRDACVTYETCDSMDSDLNELGMRSFYRNFLMQIPDVYWDIEQQGFRVDETIRDELVRKYIIWDEGIRYELFKLVGTEINVNSPKQIASLLWDNFKLPRRDSTGEEDITALLNSQGVWAKHPEFQRRVCELILEGRRVRKTVSTYLMALPDFDKRMRTTYFPCLDTGRTATGQQDPPIRPSVEVIDENGKKKHKVLGVAFQTITKHGDIGPDTRMMYVPDIHHVEYDADNNEYVIEEEEEFISADSAQAEARVIFLLAQDEEALNDIDSRDYHAWTASWFFGGTENDYSKRVLGYEHPIRFVGKTLRHAGHLGAGKRRAAISVNTDARKFKIPIAITEAIAERALKIFHSKQPKIQQIFQTQVVECLRRNRQLVAPLPYGVNAAIGGKRTFFERWGEELNRQAFSYLPQRAVSDNTKAALFRIRERCNKIRKEGRTARIKCVMESHDGLLFSIPTSWKILWGPVIQEEMQRPIDFSKCSLPRHELIIPCELEIGKNYYELKKWKDIPIITPPIVIPAMPPETTQEKFTVIDLPEDSRLTNTIYHHQVEKKLRSFEVDE